MGLVSLDTNIFISALNENSSKNKQSIEVLKRIQVKSDRVFISAILLEEFFVRVYKLKQEKDIDANLEFINLGGLCTIVDMNTSVALLAAKLRAEYSSLRAPDAIHLASAIENKAKVFITTDRRLPRKIGNLKIEMLS